MASKKSKKADEKQAAQKVAKKAEKTARKAAELAKEQAKKAREKAKKAAKKAKEEAAKLERKAKERAKKAKKADKPSKPDATAVAAAPKAAPISILGTPSNDWPVVALRARARELGLTGYSSMNKAQLLAALKR